jgi:hypothetical protein
MFGTAYHGYLEEGYELQQMADRSQVLCPRRYIIPEPVADIRACTNKGAASDDHWSLVRPSFEHTLPARFAHHRAISMNN